MRYKRVASRDATFYASIVNPDEPNPGLTRVKFQLRADAFLMKPPTRSALASTRAATCPM